jgi:LysM repeat protein/uncharacterized protein YukE
MSFVGDVEGLLHPGGDPEAIFAAATATRALAAGLRETASALDSTAAALGKSWKGTGRPEESGAAAFQAAWGAFSKAIVEYAEHLDSAAVSLQREGEALQTAQSEARKLEWVIGLTAAGGLALTIFTFGISDATADAMAAADIAVAAGVMTEVEGLIVNSLLVLSEVMDAATTVASQFMLGAVADALSIMMGKAQDGENPLSIANYTADDVSNILLGGLVSGTLGAAFNGIKPLAAFQAAHPILSSAVWNASAGFTWGVPWQFWITGQPFDPHTWGLIAESTGISFVSGALLAKLGTTDNPLGRLLGAEGDTPIPGVTKADLSNNLFTVPISATKYYLMNGGPQPAPLSAPQAGAQPPGVPVPYVKTPNLPGLPPGTAVPAVPPHIGGGTETVAPGDSLYDIAARRLGNPNLYPVLAAANPLTVGANGTISPGQKLLIPVLPPVPAGSTAHVVQAGQSLSEIASGNSHLEQEIAQLNRLKDTSVIYPGQVLIVPPGD